jgi:hypothetical protein
MLGCASRQQFRVNRCESSRVHHLYLLCLSTAVVASTERSMSLTLELNYFVLSDDPSRVFPIKIIFK